MTSESEGMEDASDEDELIVNEVEAELRRIKASALPYEASSSHPSLPVALLLLSPYLPVASLLFPISQPIASLSHPSIITVKGLLIAGDALKRLVVHYMSHKGLIDRAWSEFDVSCH